MSSIPFWFHACVMLLTDLSMFFQLPPPLLIFLFSLPAVLNQFDLFFVDCISPAAGVLRSSVQAPNHFPTAIRFLPPHQKTSVFHSRVVVHWQGLACFHWSDFLRKQGSVPPVTFPDFSHSLSSLFAAPSSFPV
jgi:hypothetical protein